MRRVTRNFLLAVGVILLLLLALGAVPSYLKSGDPYYLTATPVGDANGTATDGTGGSTATPGATATPEANDSVVDVAALSERRYPYATTALTNASANTTGQSDPYWRGPVGVKGAFTHSPFDEYDSLVQQYPEAVEGDGVLVRQGGTVYRLAVTQDP